LKRRVVWAVLGGLLVGAAAWAALDPDRWAVGRARGEPFYQGRAASAWRHELMAGDEVTAGEAFNQLATGKGEAIPVCSWVYRHSESAQARWKAVDAIGHMGKDGAPAGPDLVAALGDPDPLVRQVAVRAISELAPEMPGAVAALVPLFPDVEAIRAVAKFRRAGAEAVPALIKLFASDDPTVRWQAVRAIGKIGEPALPALPELMRLTVEDKEWEVREHAAEAMGDIGPPASAGVPALVKALRDPNARVRRDAIRSLGQIGPAAKLALPEVKTAANDPDADVKAAAVKSARQIDPAGKG
jgi:HEAT repeat protein